MLQMLREYDVLCKKLWMLCYARNYVHQSVIRRFETLDVVLCRNICYEIVARKYELKHDEYRYQVFLTCNNMLRKIVPWLGDLKVVDHHHRRKPKTQTFGKLDHCNVLH
ncbi:hypothetical protein F2Q69_00033139 [Brassica cretica]|uniref:Uncharacterized protein n=1 Tax=Brassica cretica TaxID=69181 RepID=A0A8S9SNT5_BRACR|nr:hypothetical protein F2Q69_00033139 [Brassica cretica]